MGGHERRPALKKVAPRDRRRLSGVWLSTAMTALLAPIWTARAQAPATVNVSVDATAPGMPLERVWPFHGYDEINYTTTPDGSALLGTIAAAQSSPVHVRSHFLLNTGDGTPAMKWGSTNVYTEDAAGNPVYSWTLTDGILDPDRRNPGHHHRGRRASVRRDRLHASGAFHAPDPLPKLQRPGARRRVFLSPDRLSEVGGSHSHVGDARERKLPERRGELAVGAVERTRLRLLERHVGRLRDALRLHGIGAARGDPQCGARWPGGAERRRQLPDAIPPALCDRHQRRHGQHRDAPGPRDLPRERRRCRHRRPRRDGPRQPAPTSPFRLQRGGGVLPIQA